MILNDGGEIEQYQPRAKCFLGRIVFCAVQSLFITLIQFHDVTTEYNIYFIKHAACIMAKSEVIPSLWGIWLCWYIGHHISLWSLWFYRNLMSIYQYLKCSVWNTVPINHITYIFMCRWLNGFMLASKSGHLEGASFPLPFCVGSPGRSRSYKVSISAGCSCMSSGGLQDISSTSGTEGRPGYSR